LPTGGRSVYDFAIPRRDLRPTPAEAAAAIREVERWYPDPAALRSAVERWYMF
jgi:hypothetical protein